MKILFVSQRFVLPMDTGGKIRTGKTLEQLRVTHDVTLISNVETAREGRWLAEVDRLCGTFVAVEWREPQRYTLRFFVRLALQVFSRYPVTVLNTYSRKLRRAIEELVARERFDVIVCDFVQCGLLLRDVTRCPIVLFQHNVEATIPKRHFERTTNVLARLFWWLQWRKLDAYERYFCNRFDHVIAVSENDRDEFVERYGVTRCTAIPTGVDTDYYAPRALDEAATRDLVFCGSMDWLPNEDAVLWLVRDILPAVQRRIPTARLTVVGRKPTPTILAATQGRDDVTLTGWVEDTRPYLARGAVFVVPIRIGGGTRMKIFEAMAMGRPVVSTQIGAEGLPVTSGANCFIEDDPEAFAERTASLLADAPLRARLGQAAHRFVAERFSWQSVGVEFADICTKVAATGGRSDATAERLRA